MMFHIRYIGRKEVKKYMHTVELRLWAVVLGLWAAVLRNICTQ